MQQYKTSIPHFLLGNKRSEPAAMQSSLKNYGVETKGVEYGVKKLVSQRTPGR